MRIVSFTRETTRGGVPMQTFVWVVITIILIQAIAVTILSGLVAWSLLYRRFAYHDDLLTARLLIDSNEKRLATVETLLKDHEDRIHENWINTKSKPET